ncbi:exostosin family protein [Candidatus Peregrinibacteria bacterium]|nr:exostosin family protein [Candidatus Peregrinibacteria bacterium]
MLRVFTTVLPDVPYIPLLYPNLGIQQRDSILFLNNAFAGMKDKMVEIVDRVEDADCVLLAHNWPSLKGHRGFVHAQAKLAADHRKHLIVFWHGDSDAPVDIPGAIVFRTSLYRYCTRANEIAMPAYGEDLLGSDTLTLREKHAGPPVVGFCGWAKYKNTKNMFGTLALNSLVRFGSVMGPEGMLAHRKGLSFRREAIAVLGTSDAVKCAFLLRSSYSGHSKTIGMDPENARREYRENLLGSDLALCVKGDGNYSYRFYEALSLGRIPLLIDTQCVLPLEETIDYRSFVLRVDYRELERLPDIIERWWNEIRPDEFTAMQKKAREAYEKYLRVDAFLRFVVHQLGS